MSELGTPNHRWRPGMLRWSDVRRLEQIEALLARAQRWTFDPANFEVVQTLGNQSVRLTQTDCCCPYDPVKQIEDEDLDGGTYTAEVNDRIEAYEFVTTGTERVDFYLPEMADLPRPPAECWQLHLVNQSPAVYRLTPPEGVLIGGRETIDLHPRHSITIWTDQPETGDPTEYISDEGRESYDPLDLLESGDVAPVSHGRFVVGTASGPIVATLSEDFEDSPGIGTWIVNAGTSGLTAMPATLLIDGEQDMWLPPGAGIMAVTREDDEGDREVVAFQGRHVTDPRTITDAEGAITAEDHNHRVELAGTSTQAITIVTEGLGKGFATFLQSFGTGAATLTPDDEDMTIDGETSLALCPREGVLLTYDGNNKFRTVRGRFQWQTRTTADATLTLTPNDQATVIHWQGNADGLITWPASLPANFFCQPFNLASDYKLTVYFEATDTYIRLAAGESTFLAHNGNPDGAPWEAPGRSIFPTQTYSGSGTIRYAKKGWLHTWNTTGLRPIATLAADCLYDGFHCRVALNGQANDFMEIQCEAGLLEGNSSGIYLYGGSSMGIRSDGVAFYADRGIHSWPAVEYSGTNRDIEPDDFETAIYCTASGEVNLDFPADFPGGVVFTVVNSTATDDLVTVTPAVGDPTPIPHCQSATFHTDSGGGVHVAAGQTLSGLVSVDDDDFEATPNHQARLIGVAATTADRTVAMRDDCDLPTIMFGVGNLYGSPSFVHVEPPAGGTFPDGFEPHLASFSSVLFFGNGNGEWQMFGGMYLADIIRTDDATIEVNALSHRNLYECQAEEDQSVDFTAYAGTLPSGMWGHVANPVVNDVKKAVYLTSATQSYPIPANRGATWLYDGDEFQVQPGMWALYHELHVNEAATLGAGHSGYGIFFSLGDSTNRTLTIGADTDYEGWSALLGNSRDSNANVNISLGTGGDIYGLDGTALGPCRGGWLLARGNGDYTFFPGYTCCDCGVTITYTDDMGGTTSYGEITELLFDYDTGLTLTPNVPASQMSIELTPAGVGVSIGGVDQNPQSFTGLKSFLTGLYVEVDNEDFEVENRFIIPANDSGNDGKYFFYGGTDADATLVLDDLEGATGDLLDGEGNTVLQFYGGIVRTISSPIGGSNSNGILQAQSFGF